MWATHINKIDHAPVVPFAKGIGSVQARDKESARRIEEKKMYVGEGLPERWREVREGEQTQKDEHMSSKRATIERRCITALFSFPKIPSVSECKGAPGRPINGDTGVKLIRLLATSIIAYIRTSYMKLTSWKIVRLTILYWKLAKMHKRHFRFVTVSERSLFLSLSLLAHSEKLNLRWPIKFLGTRSRLLFVQLVILC